MGTQCCHQDHASESVGTVQGRYRRVLWIALLINAALFIVESLAGLRADSASLLADSLDFLGDAANYAISLWVLGLSLATRALAALFKALTMAIFGLCVLGWAIGHAITGAIPEAPVMGVVGMLALVANLGVAGLLYTWREGDSNMRSVWLCTRNDALGNVAVMLAALGVLGTATVWPDVIVAVLMAVLALSSAWQVIGQARAERATGRPWNGFAVPCENTADGNGP